jgi:hypothetical protein
VIWVKIADGKASCARCGELFGDVEDEREVAGVRLGIVVLGRRWSVFKDVGPYEELWQRAKGSHAPQWENASWHLVGRVALPTPLRCPKCGADQLVPQVRTKSPGKGRSLGYKALSASLHPDENERR